MPYERWGMTAVLASDLTGVAISDALLEAAEDDVREAIGWSPAPVEWSTDVDADGELLDRRVSAFGKAIAWQAAYRAAEGAPAADDGSSTGIVSESFADYSASYGPNGKPPERALLAPRAARLLKRYGWHALAGRTTAGTLARNAHDWQRN